MSIKILGVAAPGGHLTVLEELNSSLICKMSIVVSKSDNIVDERYCSVTEFNRDMKIFITFFQAWKILKKQRPDIIISTGAGIAVPFFLLGRLFFGSRLIFIESASRVSSLSLTGKLVYYFVDKLYIRDRVLAQRYSRAYKNV